MSNTSSWRTSTSERLKQTDISKVALADSGVGRGCYAMVMTTGGFLCEGDGGEGGFWRGRPGAGREGVVRGEASSRWGLCEERPTRGGWQWLEENRTEFGRERKRAEA
uniref:Uncharacterized protein n=1 Tax=Fagus sylvatica TaxID=28930 RepID=A0A2N9HRE4_FAGSY